MTFHSGQSLNHYRLMEKIGEGGMGVVWKGLDTTLGREVALKMLPADLAGHPERTARFAREARLLAALNHPNVATVHGFETAGEQSFLVMELVSGQSLDETLLHGPLPLARALDVTLQVAHGLEAAHEKGIIHRDLKPANIRVNDEGVVKILDFGLAKAMEEDPGHSSSHSPTITTGGTRAGSIFGTASYMSPEQARGQALDRRTDIWSFGCVLFECLTGAGPFAAGNTGDALARLLEREPDWNSLPADTPPALRRLLKRCLRKDHRQRLRDIGDARILLSEEIAADGQTAPHGGESDEMRTAGGDGSSSAVPHLVPQPRRVNFLTISSALLLGLLMGAGAAMTLRARQPLDPASQPQMLQADLLLDETTAISLGLNRSLAISPDGRHVAYTGTETDRGASLMVRNLETGETRKLVDNSWVFGPFFSPDSLWVGYFTDLGGGVMKVPLGGGAPVRICPTSLSSRGATWGPDGTIIFSSSYNTGLSIVTAAGGPPSPLTTLREGEKSHRFPAFLPDGKTVVFVIGRRDLERWDDAEIAALNLETGVITTVIRGGTEPSWSATGHLLYSRQSVLYAVRYDPATGATGVPFQLLDGIATDPVQGPAHYSMSHEGTLVFARGGEISRRTRVVTVDLNGEAQDMNLPDRAYGRVRSSPDGRALVFQIEEANASVWTYDLERGTLSRLSSGWESEVPVWMNAGEQVLYHSLRDGLYTILRQDVGSGEPQVIFSQDQPLFPEGVSPDGRWLVATTIQRETDQDIVLLDLHDPKETRRLVATNDGEFQPAISPDGKWLAYASDESGQAEIYVTDFPSGSRRRGLTRTGGRHPLWSTDGQDLFYLNGTVMMALSLDSSGTFTDSPPRRLFQVDWAFNPDIRLGSWDLDAEGNFLLFRAEDPEPPESLSIVINFSTLLEDRSPSAGK